MRKILVLRGGALGDFIVTLPALAMLRARWPEARIEFAGNRTAAELALNRGLIDAAHSQHDARWSALYSPPALPLPLAAWLDEFDLVVNYWPDPDGALRRHFPRHAEQTFLGTEALPTQAPAAAHYCAPLRGLGMVGGDYCFALGEYAVPGRRSASPAASGASIAMHPGSGSPRKNWPEERWHELIRRSDSPILLILGEAEHRWSAMSPSSFGARVRILTQPPLETLVAELRGCRRFVGHDSGISHLAAACGVPCVLLFGPTDPAMWAPPAPHVRVLQRGHETAAIGVEDVLAAVAS